MFVFSNDSFLAKAFPYFKWSVYGLLGINMVLFFMEQTIIEGVESLAWIALLLLLEWETSSLDKPYISLFERYAIHVSRIVAYIFIIYSAYQYTTDEYVLENGYLDMFNAITWLLIVAIIEYDLYYPGGFYKIEWYIRNFVKIALYSALFVIAVLWWMDGEWLGFYDAALWIICFFFIELNILKFEDEIEYIDEHINT